MWLNFWLKGGPAGCDSNFSIKSRGKLPLYPLGISKIAKLATLTGVVCFSKDRKARSSALNLFDTETT
jgi:hypothetical protein